jgi:ATP-dependent DNA helicase RecG
MYNEENLRGKGLSDRQIKAVLYVRENGKITNKEYQEINAVSRRTATNDLTELSDKYNVLKQTGYGAGSFYEIIAQNMP